MQQTSFATVPYICLMPLGISVSWQWWKRIPYLPWYFEVIIPSCHSTNWFGSSGNPTNSDNLVFATIWSQEQEHCFICLCQCKFTKRHWQLLCIPETQRLKLGVTPETNDQFRSYSQVSQLNEWKTMEGVANCCCLVSFITPFSSPTNFFPQICKNVALAI